MLQNFPVSYSYTTLAKRKILMDYVCEGIYIGACYVITWFGLLCHLWKQWYRGGGVSRETRCLLRLGRDLGGRMNVRRLRRKRISVLIIPITNILVYKETATRICKSWALRAQGNDTQDWSRGGAFVRNGRRVIRHVRRVFILSQHSRHIHKITTHLKT